MKVTLEPVILKPPMQSPNQKPGQVCMCGGGGGWAAGGERRGGGGVPGRAEGGVHFCGPAPFVLTQQDALPAQLLQMGVQLLLAFPLMCTTTPRESVSLSLDNRVWVD